MTPGPPALVRRIVSEKRMLVGLAAAGLILDAGLYGLAIYPWTLKWRLRNGARPRRRPTWRSRGGASSRYGSRPTTGTGRRGSCVLSAGKPCLPTLAGARSLTLSRLAALADDHDLLMERRASVPDREDDSVLARLQVSMLLRGAYRDIRRFLHAIETAPEFLIIDEIALRQGDEAEAGEVLGLGLSTYYWQGDDGEREAP